MDHSSVESGFSSFTREGVGGGRYFPGLSDRGRGRVFNSAFLGAHRDASVQTAFLELELKQCAKECYALHTLLHSFVASVLCNVCILYFRVLVHVVRV